MSYSKLIDFIIGHEKSFNNAHAFDGNFYREARKRFMTMDGEKLLLPEDYDWLKEQVLQRWPKVKNGEWDYTLCSHEINNIWIQITEIALKTTKFQHVVALLFGDFRAQKSIESGIKLEELNWERLIISRDNEHFFDLDALKSAGYLYQKDDFFVASEAGEHRALTLMELRRIHFNFYKYNNADTAQQKWHNFTGTVLSKGVMLSSVPIEFFYSLFELTEEYLSATIKDHQSWRTHFNGILNLLYKRKNSSVNAFYTQNVLMRGKKVYFIDLLIDCHKATKTTFDDAASCLLAWLGLYSPSLISQNILFKSISEEALLGASYTAELLYKDLMGLDDTEQLKKEFKELITLVLEKKSINDEVIKAIKTLFAARWMIIKDTEKSYFSHPWNPRNPWIILAQKITTITTSEVKNDYLQLLVPTLQGSMTLVSELPCLAYPLNCFIYLNDTLVFLPEVISTHKNSGFFNYDFQGKKKTLPPNLNTKFWNPQYEKYYIKANTVVPQLPYYLISHLANLVKGVTDRSGLKESYSQELVDKASDAWSSFYKYFKTLPKEMRKALKLQIILLPDRDNGKALRFGKLIKKLIKPPYYCVAVTGQYFLQLALNYDPFAVFPETVTESKEKLEKMRKRSTYEVCAEWKKLSPEDATKRLFSMVFSWRHYFNALKSEKKIGIKWEEKATFAGNLTVSSEVWPIFEKILWALEHRSSRDYRCIYGLIHEGYIKPLSEDQKPESEWARKVIDGSFLRDVTIYAPEDIFYGVYKYSQENNKLKNSNEFVMFLVDWLNLDCDTKITHTYFNFIINWRFTALLEKISTSSMQVKSSDLIKTCVKNEIFMQDLKCFLSNLLGKKYHKSGFFSFFAPTLATESQISTWLKKYKMDEKEVSTAMVSTSPSH